MSPFYICRHFNLLYIYNHRFFLLILFFFNSFLCVCIVMSLSFSQLDYKCPRARKHGFIFYTISYSISNSLGGLAHVDDWFISAIFSTSMSFDHEGINRLLTKRKKKEWKRKKLTGTKSLICEHFVPFGEHIVTILISGCFAVVVVVVRVGDKEGWKDINFMNMLCVVLKLLFEYLQSQ